MRIAELTIFEVDLPLRKRIDHASATRASSRNILIRCKLADGTVGWGEGVPREYVTGETTEGAFAQLSGTPLSEQLSTEATSWPHVIALCDAFRPAPRNGDSRGCNGNALRCAVELSVLDAYGRKLGEPVSNVLNYLPEAEVIRRSPERVRYSGAIATAKPAKAFASAIAMRAYGFAQCKVKVGIADVDDARRLRRIRTWIGRRMDLRLDANEAWNASEVVQKIEPLLPCKVSCIEQPVRHEEAAALAEVRRQTPVPIMLDESLTGFVDAELAIRDQTCDLFNIRLSKCGGFLDSARLAAMAANAGLGYQLGCHPGESGVLSAAGRHWASSIADIKYLEGSYDRHLLSEPLTQEDLTFGYGGWAPPLTGAGWGIEIDEATIERLAKSRAAYRLG
jgi:L-Ala-D/L-Glu epimerase